MAKELEHRRPDAENQPTKRGDAPPQHLLAALGLNVVRMPAPRRRRPTPTAQQLKVLWGIGAICARPGCGQRLIEEGTEHDGAAVVGRMAHIRAFSPNGPRYDPDLADEAVDSAENIILLCPTDHDIVDSQASSYTVAELLDWKQKQEAFVLDAIDARVRSVGFDELEVVTQGLLSLPGKPPQDLTLPLRPEEKLRRNGLTAKVSDTLNIGYLRYDDVQAFVSRTETVQPGFGEALAAGFRERYRGLLGQGLAGDGVFFALIEWSAAGSQSFDRTAACVAVLTYLFHVCEVFET